MNKYSLIAGAFQTGSSLIKSDYNDIDIVIPLSSWRNVTDHGLTPRGMEYTNDKSLYCTYRDGEYNLIIVEDDAYSLWEKAAAELISNPHLYQDKQDRINLFRNIKGS